MYFVALISKNNFVDVNICFFVDYRQPEPVYAQMGFAFQRSLVRCATSHQLLGGAVVLNGPSS